MNILIVSATSIEIESLLSTFSFKETKNANLSSYIYRDFNIDVLITSVGMVSTAYCMGKVLQAYNYDLAINAGIAGCFDKNIPLGEVLNITTDCFPELGAEDGEYFLSLIDLKLLENDSFPFHNMELINESAINSAYINELNRVKGITVNTIHGNEENINKIKNLYHPITESMEGAAFMFACLVENLKHIQIRSVSNYVEKRNKASWDIPLAIKNLNNTLLNILNE